MKFKDNFVGVFKALANDTELITLLELPSSSMSDIKKQILEERYPEDLTQDKLSRLCVYENPSTPTRNEYIDKGWLEIDIYVHKEKQAIDRRSMIIAEKLTKLLHNNPVVGLGGLKYYNRLPNLPTHDNNWIKYGLVFNYDIVVN